MDEETRVCFVRVERAITLLTQVVAELQLMLAFKSNIYREAENHCIAILYDMGGYIGVGTVRINDVMSTLVTVHPGNKEQIQQALGTSAYGVPIVVVEIERS